MSKTTKQTPIDQLREKLSPTLKLLEWSDSPVGFLTLLQKLMTNIKNNPFSAGICEELQATIEKEAQEMRASKQRMLEWLLSKVNILEEVSVNRSWVSARSVQRYKSYLKGEQPEVLLGGSFWHGVFMDFMQVCDSVAKYGDPQPFDGFATIRIRKEVISFDEPPIPVDKLKKISPNSPEGKLLIEKLGHGFISAIIYKNEWVDRIDHEIECGTIQEIRYPDNDYAAVLRETTEKDWEAAMDSSLLQTFHWLNQLAHFGQMKLTSEEPLPKDLIRCDELSNQWQLRSFRNSFGVDWINAPVPRDKLWRLVQRFVLLLEEELKAGVKRPRQMKEETRQFTQSILEKKLLSLPLKDRNTHTYQSLFPIVCKAINQSGIDGLKEAFTDTLFKEECTAFGRKHGWRPSRKEGKKKKESAG
jgi:hypothetical protein